MKSKPYSTCKFYKQACPTMELSSQDRRLKINCLCCIWVTILFCIFYKSKGIISNMYLPACTWNDIMISRWYLVHRLKKYSFDNLENNRKTKGVDFLFCALIVLVQKFKVARQGGDFFETNIFFANFIKKWRNKFLFRFLCFFSLRIYLVRKH